MKNKPITYEEFQKALKVVNDYKSQLEDHYKNVKKQMDGVSPFVNVTKETKLWDSGCTIRLRNILRARDIYEMGYDINKVGDLEKLSIKKFSKCRGAGGKALQELKELCFYAGVDLLP